jgi:hypothetical protein
MNNPKLIERSANTRFFRDLKLHGRSVPRQDGITAIGFAVLATFIGLFGFGVLRLTPVYLNYMKVAGVLDGVYKEFDGQNPTRAAIRTSISRRFGVESVSVLSERDVVVTPDNGGFLIEVDYEHTTEFIGNIHFTVMFEKNVLVRR